MSDAPKTEAEEREYQERLREMNEALLVSSVRQHELTEQARRAEAALRESEEKYRSLFESIDEGYCIIEVLFDENEHPVDYRFLDVSPSFEKQTGIENAVGRRMREIAPRHEEHWFEIYGRIAQTGEPLRFENRAEQLHRWYDVYAFRYGQPESRQVAILFNDITKRKLAEAELGKWEYIFNHAGWAVAVANPDDNTLVLVNPAFARMHGYTVEELTGQPLAMTYAPEVRAELPGHVAAAHEQGDYIYESPHVRKDGTTFPVLTHVTTFKDERGRILYRSATLQDITERKRTEEALRESEERFRLLLESAKEYAIFTTDLERRVNSWNRGAEMMFGYAESEIIGQPGDILFTPEDRERGEVEREVETTLAEGRAANERWHVRKDGSRFYGSGSVMPLRDHNGQLLGFTKIIRDLTEQREIEEGLRASEQRLQRMVTLPRVGVLTFDYAGVLLHANDAFLEMVGYDREEFAAKTLTWQDFTPSEYVEASARVMEQLRETGRGGPYEKEYFRKDGTRIWFMFVAADLGDGTIVEYAVDISDRKRAEAALRESEARIAADLTGMRRLYELHTKLSNETDLNAALEEILAAACEFTGTERGCVQLVSDDGERLEMFAWRGYADDSLFIGHFRHEGSKVACDTARRYGERLIIEDIETFAPLEGTRDREVALAENIRATQSTPMVSRAGEIIGVLSNQFNEPHRPTDDELRLIDLLAWTAADFISRHRAEIAMRESEERLRTLIENLPGGAVFVVDKDLRYLIAEGEALANAGFAPADLIGRTISEAMPPELVANYETLYRRTLAGEAFEHEHTAHDRTFVSRGVPLANAAGKIYAVLAVSYDITDRKRAEQALRVSEEQLRRHAEELEQRVAERTAELSETNEALQKESSVRQRAEAARTMLLRRFVNVQEEERRRLSRELHDQFGQQLAALNINLNLLEEGYDEPDKLHERIDVISSIVKQLDADVDFLAWELRPTALDDLGLIAVLDSYVKEWSKHNDVPVQFHRDETDERLAPEIEITLYRIAQEALNNVSKHAQAKTVSVILEWRRDTLSLIVEDDGRGFDTSELETADGRKLGLTGMSERAVLVGGKVDIESQPGSGTTVFVRIPVTSDAGGGQTAYH